MQNWPVCSVSPVVLPSLRAAPAQKGVFYRTESSVVLAPMDHSIRWGWTPTGRSQMQTDARNGSMGFDATLEGRTPRVSATSDPDSAGRTAAQLGKVVHAALLRHRAQPLPRDREGPAQQTAAAALELLQPRLPAFAFAADPLQDS